MIAALAIVGSPSAQAQQNTPKERYYIGAGEVELYSGKFMYSNTDISVGAPGTPSELALERYYAVRDYGVSPFGMTSGHNHEVRIYRYRYAEDPWAPPNYSFTYFVVVGRTMYTFDEGFGSPIVYLGTEPGTHLLSRSGQQGPYEFTGPNGLKIYFGALGSCVPIGLVAGPNCSLATSLVEPGGRTLEYIYDTTTFRRLRLVKNNLGYALGFNYSPSTDYLLTQVCAVNLTVSTASVASPCPGGARSATYVPPASPSGVDGIVSYTDPDNKTTSYTYSADISIHNIATIRSPASAAADVTVVYDSSSRRVTWLTYANGSTTSYTYDNSAPPETNYGNYWTDVTTAAGTTRHNFFFLSNGNFDAYAEPPNPAAITDPLGRTTRFLYGGSLLGKMTYPELNALHYSYGARGNRTETRQIAKPGSGQADIVSTASYAATCSNFRTCDKPTSVTDARGNTTDFTYDPVHGGLLTETGPAVNGVRPQKRYAYAQRTAWITTGGGYAATAPVWLLTQDSYCRATAASGGGCGGGAVDEVVTTYDYGPDSGPNNLLLRGRVVTADGTSLLTCYGYDGVGNKISETAPRAGLSLCP